MLSKALVIGVVSAGLTFCTYHVDEWGRVGRFAGVLDGILLAATYIGVLVSGNVHQANVWATVVVLFVIYSLSLALVLLILVRLHRALRGGRR